MSDLKMVCQSDECKLISHCFFCFLIILFIYFWLHWVFVAARGLSLVAANGGLLFVAVLLIAVASLVAEHGL